MDSSALLDIFALFYYFIFASLLIVIFVYDLKHKLIPDFATFGIAALGIVRLVTYNLQLTTCGMSDMILLSLLLF